VPARDGSGVIGSSDPFLAHDPLKFTGHEIGDQPEVLKVRVGRRARPQ
jgi:hypothetical protein